MLAHSNGGPPGLIDDESTSELISERYDLKSEPNCLVELQFEVTNVGEKITSLSRTIVVRALASGATAERFELQIQEPDLQLSPHSQRLFTASATTGATYIFCWYKRYRFKVLRGSGAVIRYRNAENVDIGFLKYWLGYLRLRTLRRV